jgi:hypothetical protein
MSGGTPEGIRDDLAERFGDPDRLGVVALADPACGPRLRALGARSLTTLAGPIFYAPPNAEAECWRIVAAAAGSMTVEDAPAAGRRRGPGRYGKEYSGAAVEEVVRGATVAGREGRNLGRTLRDDLAAEVDGVTPYAVDLVFGLMRDGKLATDEREGWLKIGDQFSPTPSYVNLRELRRRS